MIGAYRALRDLGHDVPGETALIGCDGIEETEYHDPSLSTLAVPMEEMCRRAWELLIRRMERPNRPLGSVMLSAALELRDSSTGRPHGEGTGFHRWLWR